ncbi:MAG: 1-deoxy-D-xylulose-5-phosphate synthase, partial [Oscillospiraceae bacterium]|nr:1-deoxy-D-xylulose-5-phosphate synthase [Oscillospiraceae bacterium]
VGYLRQVPGMQVLCPASQAELKRMLRQAAFELDGPVAVRYPKGGDGQYDGCQWEDQCYTGALLTLVTYGTTINDVLAAAGRLRQDGQKIDVIKLDRIQPLDARAVEMSVRATGRLLVVEETAAIGCLGDAIVSNLMQHGIFAQCSLMNLGDHFTPHGDLKSLRAFAEIDENSIYQKAKELLLHET